MAQSELQYLKREELPALAYVYSAAKDKGAHLPTVMFCAGFKSDMQGTKALYLEEKCKELGQAYIRFDYSGHGESEGDFKDGTIGAWFKDALAILDEIIQGSVIIIGSSMGGWIGLLLAQSREERVKGFIGIAAAPDFTERLFHEEFSEEQREAVQKHGYVEIPNDYSDDPYIFTKALFEDGKKRLLLNREHIHNYPITLLHGLEDKTVPRETPLAIKEQYTGGSLDIIFTEDGDHSLSRPEDLELLLSSLKSMNKLQNI